ncbi:phage transcriptional regulator [Paraburkholderia hospita]|uniref:Phage transcriptional regulator n=1 Tax=Paraburkholderia hospita TaxID=169430 RepID=A0ABN0FNX3_9BURK|nr:AlpA family phage regulatory protein [Paraburkholderia hospita]EIN00391.1 phage transcriptional regulator [Paraburkholderia hospita]OUL88402.1 transcriptional regulator [Paraburkholderia hospita]
MTHELPGFLEKTAFLREKHLIGDPRNQTPGLLPFSRATLWRRVKDGTFPRPIKLSERTTAWPTAEIRKWILDPAGYRASPVLAGG